MAFDTIKSGWSACIGFITNKLVFAGLCAIALAIVFVAPIQDFAVGQSTMNQMLATWWSNLDGFVHNPFVCFVAALAGLWMIGKGVSDKLSQDRALADAAALQARELAAQQAVTDHNLAAACLAQQKQMLTIPLQVARQAGMSREFREFEREIVRIEQVVERVNADFEQKWTTPRSLNYMDSFTDGLQYLPTTFDFKFIQIDLVRPNLETHTPRQKNSQPTNAVGHPVRDYDPAENEPFLVGIRYNYVLIEGWVRNLKSQRDRELFRLGELEMRTELELSQYGY